MYARNKPAAVVFGIYAAAVAEQSPADSIAGTAKKNTVGAE